MHSSNKCTFSVISHSDGSIRGLFIYQVKGICQFKVVSLFTLYLSFDIKQHILSHSYMFI